MIDEQSKLMSMNEQDRLSWFNRSKAVIHTIGLCVIRINGHLVASGHVEDSGELIDMWDEFNSAIDGPRIESRR